MEQRVEKLAKVLIHYLLEINSGQQLAIRTNPFADELDLAVFAHRWRVIL